jgi:hypothetical protein
MTPPWVAVLREFAADPEALFFPLKTKTLGTIPVWAHDIRAAGTDKALLDMVLLLLNAARVQQALRTLDN